MLIWCTIVTSWHCVFDGMQEEDNTTGSLYSQAIATSAREICTAQTKLVWRKEQVKCICRIRREGQILRRLVFIVDWPCSQSCAPSTDRQSRSRRTCATRSTTVTLRAWHLQSTRTSTLLLSQSVSARQASAYLARRLAAVGGYEHVALAERVTIRRDLQWWSASLVQQVHEVQEAQGKTDHQLQRYFPLSNITRYESTTLPRTRSSNFGMFTESEAKWAFDEDSLLRKRGLMDLAKDTAVFVHTAHLKRHWTVIQHDIL